MNFEDCVKFANAQIICSVATVDSDQPHVRMFGMWFADKDGFYFSSRKTESVYRQLPVDPKLELCFYAPPEAPLGQGSTIDMEKVMRATGTAEFMSDPALKERLLNDRPFLRPLPKTRSCFA